MVMIMIIVGVDWYCGCWLCCIVGYGCVLYIIIWILCWFVYWYVLCIGCRGDVLCLYGLVWLLLLCCLV